jgi:hypothetical protein
MKTIAWFFKVSTKLKLLYNQAQWSTLHSAVLEPLWDQYFDRVIIDPTSTYETDSCLVYADYRTANEWINEWKDKGFKIIIDLLWDSHLDHLNCEANQLVLRNLKFYWHNECLWYRHLGYFNLVRTPIEFKSFLMLMNLKKWHRTAIYNKLKHVLENDAIFSYQGLGISMQNGNDILDFNARYTDIEWYNKTRFSVVVETGVIPLHKNCRPSELSVFTTEKSFKPFAFQHPLIIWGPCGIIRYLNSLGFETFDHVIDQSYDDIKDHNARLDKLIKIIDDLNTSIKKDKNFLLDPLTIEKTKHNHNLFYDKELAHTWFKEEIVDVIYEFACR